MRGVKSKFKKACRWILAFAFIIVVILIIRNNIVSRGYESAIGSYITTGGQSYLVIKKGFVRKLKIDEGFFILNENLLSRYSYTPKIHAKYRDDKLFIFQKEHYFAPGFLSPPYLLGYIISENHRSMMVLEPSKTITGDWDLTDLQISINKGGLKTFFRPSFWLYLFISGSYKKIIYIFSQTVHSKESLYFELNPRKAPIRSFLHRVDDPKMTEYFRARFQENPSERTLELIRQLVSKYPSDSWLRLHEVEQEALHRDPEKAKELWKKWEEENKPASNTLLLKNAQHVSWIVSFARFHNDYPDLEYCNEAFPRTLSLNLEDKKIWMKKLFDTKHIIYPVYPLVPDLFSPGYKSPSLPDFLEFQVTVKALMVQSILDLFPGKREENLQILSGLFLLGSSFRMSFTYPLPMIGVAMQNITVTGLLIYTLNACESKEDLEELDLILEILNGIEKPPVEYGNPYYNSPCVILSHTKVSGKDMPNYLATQTGAQIADTRFQLLRVAVAAKYNLVTNGDFPKTERDFAPFLSEGLPEDEFSKGEPLRYIQRKDDEFFVYSIGPDETDDKAAFSYDPTNGTITPGDVYIRIPREREFPFPREGVKAKNAYELLEQFPNGLPPDPYADTRGRPFSIIESSDDNPLVVFSFGPDTDEEEFTSCTASSFMERTFEPVPTPEPPSNASYARSLQWVMRRSEETPPPPGCWTLEPMYDPTNGIVSPGDLFIEIPK